MKTCRFVESPHQALFAFSIISSSWDAPLLRLSSALVGPLGWVLRFWGSKEMKIFSLHSDWMFERFQMARSWKGYLLFKTRLMTEIHLLAVGSSRWPWSSIFFAEKIGFVRKKVADPTSVILNLSSTAWLSTFVIQIMQTNLTHRQPLKLNWF